jgi:hypothetical protein
MLIYFVLSQRHYRIFLCTFRFSFKCTRGIYNKNLGTFSYGIVEKASSGSTPFKFGISFVYSWTGEKVSLIVVSRRSSQLKNEVYMLNC